MRQTNIRTLQLLAGRVVLVFVLLCGINQAHSSDLLTAHIIEATSVAAPACLDWQIIGTCFWLHCDLFGCTVRTSAKVSHFLPDLVVTVQTEPARQAWKEMRLLLQNIQESAIATGVGINSDVSAGYGAIATPSAQRLRKSLRYFEADVFGHPQPDLSILSGFQYTCSAVTDRLQPYFQSALDILGWRNPTFDSSNVASWIPGRYEIGSWPARSWGSIYPRTGWIQNVDSAMGAAVVAQRAAFIATGNDDLRPHFAVSRGHRTNRAPERIDTNNAFKGKWQLIHPVVTNDCSVFGTDESPMRGYIREDHHLVWNLWRGYKCCRREGQVFIEDVEF